MNDLLNVAIEAAGGLDRWNQVKTVSASVSLTGGLYRIKQQPAGMPEVRLMMHTDRPEVSVSPFPAPEHTGRFTPDRVWTEAKDGAVADDLSDPRSSFAGASLMTPWTPLQLLYFNSYAMWNYLSTPFLFARPGFQFEELAPHQEAGETWRTLKVTFPDDVPTHTREQTFYFNTDGLLQRVDYRTDVAGGVASHYVFDHTDFEGIKIPTFRRVVARTEAGPKIHSPSAVLLRIWDVKLG